LGAKSKESQAKLLALRAYDILFESADNAVFQFSKVAVHIRNIKHVVYVSPKGGLQQFPIDTPHLLTFVPFFLVVCVVSLPLKAIVYDVLLNIVILFLRGNSFNVTNFFGIEIKHRVRLHEGA